MTTPRVALAVNPTSGQGRGARAGAAAARRLTDAGLDVAWLTGADAAELGVRVRAAVADGVDALVVVGGDGMVNLGVSTVAGTGLPLGIVPAGTGNDVARALGLPVDDAEAAAEAVGLALATDARQVVDAARCAWREPDGTAAGRWFVGVLGAGFDAIVNERANRWRWPRGRAKYVAAMLRELPVFRPRAYTIELDGIVGVGEGEGTQVWSTPAMLVAVGNGPSYGGGMRVTPDARLDDGLLDVMVVEPISRAELVRIFPRVYAGTHVDHPAVTIRRARSVTVAAPGIVGYGDGERFGPLPMTMEAVPGALQVLAGRPAEVPDPARPPRHVM
jgi:diacylglycerol kinase (ATP)